MKKNILTGLALVLSLNFSGLAMKNLPGEIKKTEKDAAKHHQEANNEALKRDEHEQRRYNKEELAKAEENKAAALRKYNDNAQYYQDQIDLIKDGTNAEDKNFLTAMVDKYRKKSIFVEKETAQEYLSRKANKAKNKVARGYKKAKKGITKFFGNFRDIVFSPVESGKSFYGNHKKACIIVATTAATVAVTLYAVKNCRWLREKLGLIDEEKDQVYLIDEHGNHHAVYTDAYQPVAPVTVTTVVKPVNPVIL